MLNPASPSLGTHACFQETHWSVVLAAGQIGSARAAAALETLCRAYWPPLYAFIRRRGYNPEEAQDLTQEFFAELLERNDLTTVGPEKDVFAHFS